MLQGVYIYNPSIQYVYMVVSIVQSLTLYLLIYLIKVPINPVGNL
jgi:hypothetical protein